MQPNLKKAPRVWTYGAFFVAVVFLLSVSRPAWAAEPLFSPHCSQLSSFQSIYKTSLQTVTVDYVYDGDTVRLADGRRVRLLGVNTPELAKDKRPAQPLAKQARIAVEQWLAKAESVQLLLGQEERDRYGRVLGHLFNAQGQNLEAALLVQGLAFAIVVPPNTRHGECFLRSEAQARKRAIGIWSHDAWQPVPAKQAVAAKKTGFQRVSGRVTRVDSGKNLWIELDHALVLRADTTNFPNFWVGFTPDLMGRKLVVRGWLIRRKLSNSLKAKGFKEWLMVLSSPYAIEGGVFSQEIDLFGG